MRRRNEHAHSRTPSPEPAIYTPDILRNRIPKHDDAGGHPCSRYVFRFALIRQTDRRRHAQVLRADVQGL